ncbi:hypothetical protein ACFY2K_42810 [Kitasatospora sp. NPDC001309]|uniref:hypothetical protein n=1 Tax=Kitasatospora sp. NPDC001309 TaxID=3364013 RepID=UPI0036743F84
MRPATLAMLREQIVTGPDALTDEQVMGLLDVVMAESGAADARADRLTHAARLAREAARLLRGELRVVVVEADARARIRAEQAPGLADSFDAAYWAPVDAVA